MIKTEEEQEMELWISDTKPVDVLLSNGQVTKKYNMRKAKKPVSLGSIKNPNKKINYVQYKPKAKPLSNYFKGFGGLFGQ